MVDLLPFDDQCRRVTKGGGSCGVSFPFLKVEKKCPNLERKYPDCGHLWVLYGYNFSFKMTFLRVSRAKTRIIFRCGAILSCVVSECLSKCPNSKKTPLAYKIPGYAPAMWKVNWHVAEKCLFFGVFVAYFDRTNNVCSSGKKIEIELWSGWI